MSNSESISLQPPGGGDGTELTDEQLEATAAGASYEIVDRGDGTWGIQTPHWQNGALTGNFSSYAEAEAFARYWFGAD